MHEQGTGTEETDLVGMLTAPVTKAAKGFLAG